jgi:hypothetical protein
VDLNAPQRRDDGQEYYGYSLINEIAAGDLVFHYHKDTKAIVAWSLASGELWEDRVIWGAHGTVAREANVRPYARPGWRYGLVGTQPIDPPVTLDALRERQDDIQLVRERLEARYHRPVYFPFEPPDKRDMRPTQAYLTKLPAEIVTIIPKLAAVAVAARSIRNGPSVRAEGDRAQHLPQLGAEYRPADEEVAVSESDPIRVDPALVERGTRGHATTQNALAAYLRQHSLEPRSPTPEEAKDANYDLAWVSGDTTYVAEVKSITDRNEESQLRFGLGQVLRYRHALTQRWGRTVAVLVVERKPHDSEWAAVCSDLGVILAWPTALSRVTV